MSPVEGHTRRTRGLGPRRLILPDSAPACSFSSRVRSYIITFKGQGARNSLSVKIRLAVCLLLATVPLWAPPPSHPAKVENPSDPGYLYALTAANRFLHALQTEAVEAG